MKSITSTELRKRISAILDDVERGERVLVSRNGRVIAEVVPAEAGPLMPNWKRPRPRLAMPGVSLSALIIAERDEGP